eukprot:scaffold46171_cov29-Tisochrysis_lutea.AAC.8
MVSRCVVGPPGARLSVAAPTCACEEEESSSMECNSTSSSSAMHKESASASRHKLNRLPDDARRPLRPCVVLARLPEAGSAQSARSDAETGAPDAPQNDVSVCFDSGAAEATSPKAKATPSVNV